MRGSGAGRCARHSNEHERTSAFLLNYLARETLFRIAEFREGMTKVILDVTAGAAVLKLDSPPVNALG